MNEKLIDTIRKGMTEDNRTRLFALLRESGAGEHPLMNELEDLELSVLMNTTAGLIAKAVNTEYNRDPNMIAAYQLGEVTNGIESIIRNPAAVNFVQAIMMLTIALLKDEPNP